MYCHLFMVDSVLLITDCYRKDAAEALCTGEKCVTDVDDVSICDSWNILRMPIS